MTLADFLSALQTSRLVHVARLTSTARLKTSQRGKTVTTPTKAEALAWLRTRITTEQCKALLLDLVRVPSPQTALMEHEPLLRAFIKTCVDPRLREMGMTQITYDPMGNLHAQIGPNGGPALMLITNAMNQPQNTMANAYAGDVASGEPYGLPGEVVFGKGASEQKANMTAMLLGTAAFLASGRPLLGRLVHLCCLSGETGKHDAIKSIVEHTKVRADMAYLGGSSLELSLGNRGRIDIFVKVRGKPGHSSGPQNACNAVTGAIAVVKALEGVDHKRSDPELGAQTLTVTHIRSFPDSTHTVQDLCELTVDCRLLPGDDPDEVFERVAKTVGTLDGAPDPVSGHPFAVEVVKGPFMYPSRVTPDAPVVALLNRASTAMLGRPPTQHYANNAFDQGYLNHIGIPTVNWGPGEYKYAHTDLDMASVERVRDAALVHGAMLIEYLT